MKYILPLVAALFFAASAVAQHTHGSKGPNGGQMEDVAGVDAELLISGKVITLNIFDEGSKPVPTKGFTASALIVLGTDRETLTLMPSGENALRGEAKKDIGKGSTITVTLRTAAGRSGQARFRN